MVLPQTTELHFPVQNSGVACSFFDEEQSGKKGNGPGEYFGIRPYVDGDPMKLIHWKLTGKTDEYMVKEVEVPMMRMPLIFLETFSTGETFTGCRIIPFFIRWYLKVCRTH